MGDSISRQKEQELREDCFEAFLMVELGIPDN
jgi:hypothetical protein